MGVRVLLCEPLVQYSQSRREVTVEECGNLDDVIKSLGRLYPGMERRILDDQDRVRRYVNVFLNGERVEDDPVKVAVEDHDKVFIIQSVAGG